MIRLAAMAGAWALSLILAVPAMAADLALVIGNQNYARAPDAVSARPDAQAVSEALQQGGYEVISGTDLNRREMRRLIADFAGRVGQADRVVVFYSGHALRTGGRSYLAPVDQGNDSLVEVMLDGVPLDLLLRLAGRNSGQAVAFIDAAQLDGFTPRAFAEPGLAHIEPPEGVLVVSAAAPGRAIARRSAGRSQFGRNVVQKFLAPGVTISQAVGSLGSRAWVAGDTSSSLALIPSGRDAGEGAGTGEPAPAAVESRLNLTRSERRDIQLVLTALGYDTRGTEGIFGPGTRSAIRKWQRANDLRATGYLTQEQVAQINRQAREAEAAAPTPETVESRLGLTLPERRRIQEDLNALGYDTRGTGGIFGSGTRSAIRSWQRANDLEPTGYLTKEQVAQIGRQAAEATAARPTPETVESRLDLTRAQRSQIQEDLNVLGYDTRGTDGNFGPGTRTAIRNWQRANDLEETGYLTADQIAAIGRQASQAGAEAGPRPAEIEARLDLSRAERSQIQEDLSLLGYDTRGMDGTFGPATRTAIRNWQRENGFEETGYLTGEQLALLDQQTRQAGTPPTDVRQPPPGDPASAEAALNLTRNDRLSIEQRLAYLGFPPGAQDGFFDADARWAIEAYQRSRGYPATGYLDRQTVAGIVRETQDARTGIVTGAEILFDILRGLGGQQ